MSTPPKSALRKAAKGAVMAGTAALAAVAVGTLVKRRLDGTAPANGRGEHGQSLRLAGPDHAASPRLAGPEDGDPLPRKESE
jgi:hypothetical protein